VEGSPSSERIERDPVRGIATRYAKNTTSYMSAVYVRFMAWGLEMK
jgi:hypothetical protein